MNRSTLDPDTIAGFLAFGRATIAGFLAFGRATIAFLEVSGLVMSGPELTGEADDLFVELQVTQARLRCLFTCGRDEAASLLAISALVLADRTTDAIERARSRTGW